MSRRQYAQAESRIRESVILRRAGLDHTYAGRAEDLEIMRVHHERLGQIPPYKNFFSWWRRFFGRGA
jgi:hypothetical protein